MKTNPFKVGDRVALRPDVLQRHARSVPAHAGYTREQFAWRDTLRTLNNAVGTVSRVFDSKHTNVDFEAPGNPEIGLKPFKGTIGIDYTELVSEEQHNAANAKADEIITKILAERTA